MSVKQLETAVAALTAKQKTELQHRKEAFLANPSIAGQWEGTPEKINQHLHARRAQKTSGSYSLATAEDIDRALRTEIARRVEDVESGKETGIPSREVFAEARKKLRD